MGAIVAEDCGISDEGAEGIEEGVALFFLGVYSFEGERGRSIW
jgi:hypothetical protein